MSNTLITKFQFKQKRVKLFELLNQTEKKTFGYSRMKEKQLKFEVKLGREIFVLCESSFEFLT